MQSLVVPVYRNAGSIAELLEAVAGLHRSVPGGGVEGVFVVDGSPDDSWERLRAALPRMPFPSQLLRHSRNFGSFPAIRTGLAAARGDAFGVMAADLQEPAELVATMFARLRSGDADVVFGQREARDDPAAQQWASRIFWRLYRRFVNRDVPAGGVDIFACNRAVRDALLGMGEANSSLLGQVFWLGFRREFVPYARGRRVGGGPSGWSWRKRIRYMLDSVFAFTDLPITLLTAIGFLGVVATLGLSASVFAAWAAGWIAVAGYTPIMLLLSFGISANLLALGIVGQYVYRVFENTKGRPLGVAMSHDIYPGTLA